MLMKGNVYNKVFVGLRAGLRESGGFFQGAKACALLLLTAAWCLQGYSQAVRDGGIEDEPKVQRLSGASGDHPLLQGATAVTQYMSGYEYDKVLKNIITLSVKEDTALYIPADFTATVRIRIEYGASPSSLQEAVDDTLTVSYDKDEGSPYRAKSYFHFAGAAYVKVTVLQVPETKVGAIDVRDLLQLENELRATRYYHLKPGVLPLSMEHSTPGAGVDTLKVSWQWPLDAGHTHTQLEWTWVEEELITHYYQNNSLNYALLFENNSTRIDLPYGKDSYSIPLLYGNKGKLYYRLRAVNLSRPGARVDGPWSAVQAQAFSGHEDALNWQSTLSFAEEGKHKAVVQYYDGTLRSRQTVTKENTQNTTITAETFYDGQGRPAVQVLPAPGPQKVIRYTAGLNLFEANEQLNLPFNQKMSDNPADFFDLQPVDTRTSITPALSARSGAAYYYSSANTLRDTGLHAYIPQAEGYPYTVTRYTPDGTGRVMAQSGVGGAMKMGSNHETRYYYGTPSQEELDGLFGTDAGDYTHYFKNMVRDPNGQMSVSYVDMQGRTIATALAGAAPEGMDSLLKAAVQYPNQQGTSITRNLLSGNSNVVKNNSLESVNTLLVPAPTDFNFRYELNPQSLKVLSCNNTPLAFDCMYDLEIAITDESGDTPPLIKKFSNVRLEADHDPTTEVEKFSEKPGVPKSNIVSFQAKLTEGSYSVRKTLTLSEVTLQKYREAFASDTTLGLCHSEGWLVDSVYQEMLRLSPCDGPAVPPACEQCNDDLKNFTTYRDHYLDSLGLSSPSSELEAEIQASYDNARLYCDRLCNPSGQTSLAAKRTLMLSDMMPYSGQYARQISPHDQSSGAFPMYDRYDIFSTAHEGQPFFRHPVNSSGGPGYYFTELNAIDPVIHPGGSNELLNRTSKEEFATQFSYSWAESLLPYHPEYLKLVYAEQHLSESYKWLNSFMATTTYAEAAGKGYLFTDAGNLSDPFFTLPDAEKNSMVEKLKNYRHDLSLWQIAYGDAKCKDIAGPPQRSACYRSAPKVPPFSLTAAELDQVWNTFKSLYAGERDQFVYQYLAKKVPLDHARDLRDEEYLLHFPTDQKQLADQLKEEWSWYPETPGGAPRLDGLPYGTTVAQSYSSRCQSYIQGWRQALQQCPTLAERSDKETILSEITSDMVLVCEKGSNEANPFGASSVAPTTPQDGSPRSFEAVIKKVFLKYNISWDYLCNPYVIEFPKPYGKGPVFTTELMTKVDSCNCNQFARVKSEAAATGAIPDNLASLNHYLDSAYHDTLTLELFTALRENCSRLGKTACVDDRTRQTIPSGAAIPCDCYPVDGSNNMVARSTEGTVSTYAVPTDSTVIECVKRVCDTTGQSFVLRRPQPFPAFLKCGFVAPQNCLDCAGLSDLLKEFKESNLFQPPYNAGPFFDSTGAGADLDSTAIRQNTLFARFVNYHTGLQFTWMEYARAVKATSCNLATYTANGSNHTPVLCPDNKPLSDTAGLFVSESPCQQVYNKAVALAQQIYEQRKKDLLATFDAAYRAQCLAAKDSFTVSYTNSEYHYTLYYYDGAGSLVKTVPPKGVQPDFSATFLHAVQKARKENSAATPAHQQVTHYRYNSLGGVVQQASPDGGTSRFWYDRLGRLVVSQNARQKEEGTYSYTLYDDLGRITEVGQKPHTTAMSQTISQDPAALKSWIIQDLDNREQVTRTVYDKAYGTDVSQPVDILDGLVQQKNLRNRVSYTMTLNKAADQLNYHAATFYTYDIHGNVDTLVQAYKGISEMNTSANSFKLMAYDYDLVSGKVNSVHYQPGRPDAFYHRYSYDAENRLTSVETSRDQVVWERDAAYLYYRHGPLARTVLGEKQVQGMDYAYTLQGWLKGVNSTSLDPATDIGRDGWRSGSGVPPVARDVVGFALHYYDKEDNGKVEMDYKAINDHSRFARPLGGNVFTSLYNGNIGAISQHNSGLQKGASAYGLPLLYHYRYDQLNRLVGMQAYKGLNTATNQWNTPEFTALEEYRESARYDPNGNILAYRRNGAPSAVESKIEMDKLKYWYYYFDGAGVRKTYNPVEPLPGDLARLTNQLAGVDDSVSTVYGEDLEDQDAENYRYDKIGNLTRDLSEGIGTSTADGIFWTVYGKISRIEKSSGTISYTYDAAGNRISKTAGGKTTVYVRDASGNVMSVYEVATGQTSVRQAETYLYGSSRLGVVGEQTVVVKTRTLDPGYSPATVVEFMRGEKRFELSNHLGNVLATVSDKKLQHSSGNGTVDYYTADVLSAQDYYPFGMLMPGRKGALVKDSTTGAYEWKDDGGGYRYGFNGKENDNELKGAGNQQDYGMRIYDPRVARFLSVDPIAKEYSELTPYQFASNRPIDGIDLDGLEYMRNGRTSVYGLNTFQVNISSYTLKSLWIKNDRVHNIVQNHPRAKEIEQSPNDDDGRPEVVMINKQRDNRKGRYREIRDVKEAAKTMSGDMLGGFIDIVIWSKKTYYDKKYDQELMYASESLGALSKADNLVRSASNHSTFPKLLNNSIVKRDLVNYLTDLTMPQNASIGYKVTLAVWGNLLFNNREAIEKGQYSFMPKVDLLRTKTTIINADGWQYKIRIPIVVGNNDPELKRATDMLNTSNIPPVQQVKPAR